MSTKSIFLFIGVQLISISLFAQVTPVWQNYIGGMNSESIYNSAVLSNGDIVVIGSTSSINALDADYGVNTSYSGGLSDAFISRFSGNGDLIWWTLYGSNGSEYICCLKEDIDGSLWVAGRTTGDVPVSLDAIRIDNVGEFPADIFLTHFDADGEYIEATLLGGDETESPSAIGFVGNQIAVLGVTSSIGLGFGDMANDVELNTTSAAFIAVLNSVSSLESFSYFEGNESVIGGDINITGFQSADGNFIFYRGTTATEGIATAGAEFPVPFETQNGFIVKLTPQGVPVWGTYANYSSVFRNASELGEDYFATYGKAFIGQDQSTDGAFQETLLGEQDGFITIWNQGGDMIWSTYFGFEEPGSSGEMINCVGYHDNRIYFGGYLKQGGNMSTPNAWISNTDNIDSPSLSMFGWFDLNGELEYCTYVVYPDAEAIVRTLSVDDNQLVLGLSVGNLAEWTSSPNSDQHYSGETDVCLLAFDLSTATDDLIIEEMVGVYPNPTTDELYFTGMNVIGASVTVYDSQGRVVIKENLNSSLNVSNLDSGYYYGTIITSQGNGRNFKFSKL